MATSKRIPTDGGLSFGQTPFSGLSSDSLPSAQETPPADTAPATKPARKNRGRVDILRVKAGRGGKTVTVVKNFVGIGFPEKEQLAEVMQRTCGTGGTVKNGQIEIQGDQRQAVARILTEAGFHPVFAVGWSVVFAKARPVTNPRPRDDSKPGSQPLLQALVERGVTPSTAQQTVTLYPAWPYRPGLLP